MGENQKVDSVPKIANPGWFKRMRLRMMFKEPCDDCLKKIRCPYRKKAYKAKAVVINKCEEKEKIDPSGPSILSINLEQIVYYFKNLGKKPEKP